MEKEPQKTITNAIGTATRYGYYDNARKQLQHGLSESDSDETRGRLYRTRGVLEVLDALYGTDPERNPEGLYAQAVVYLVRADTLLNDSNERTQQLIIECMHLSGLQHLGEWYEETYNASRKPLSLQMAEFPEIRKMLLE